MLRILFVKIAEMCGQNIGNFCEESVTYSEQN